jgi:excisionase family DNA binding protein
MAELRPEPPRRRWWKPGELARRVGLSARTIERYCDQGVLPCTRTPKGHRLIAHDAVEAFVRGMRPPTAA